MRRAPLPGIPLPRWLMKTQSMELNSVDVVVAMALVLRIHGTADAVRQLAHRIRDKVCMEHRPKMRALARMESDDQVLRTALTVVQRATDALGIYPGQPFPVSALLQERCMESPQ